MKECRFLLFFLMLLITVAVAADSMAASVTINHAGGSLSGTLSSLFVDANGTVTLTVSENLGSSGSGSGTTDTEAPSIPSGLSASAVSSSQINLSWTASTDNVGVAGYKIYRGGAQIATTNSTSYSNTGLSASTGYCYNLSAYDSAGNTSNQGTQACATTSASTGGGTTDTEAPSVPTNLNAAAASSSQINITWTASSDNVSVAGYKIYRDGSQIATTNSTSYSNTGLSASTGYCYKVAAYDSAGNNSDQSSQGCATTSAANSGGGSGGSTSGGVNLPIGDKHSDYVTEGTPKYYYYTLANSVYRHLIQMTTTDWTGNANMIVSTNSYPSCNDYGKGSTYSNYSDSSNEIIYLPERAGTYYVTICGSGGYKLFWNAY